MTICGHESFQPGADRRPGADPRRYRARGQRPAQQPHGLRCRLTRRIRRANLHQRPRKAGSGAGARCIAQQRPCAGDEARTQAGTGCHAAAGDSAETGARRRFWFGSLREKAAAPCGPGTPPALRWPEQSAGGASPNNTWDTATSRTLPAILNWHRIDSKIFGVIDRKGYLRLATDFSAVWAYTPVWLNRR